MPPGLRRGELREELNQLAAHRSLSTDAAAWEEASLLIGGGDDDALADSHSDPSVATYAALPLHPASLQSALRYPECEASAAAGTSPPPAPACAYRPSAASPLSPSFLSRLRVHGFSSDPLPKCSALNCDLTLNLLSFVRFVQAPTMHAVACDRKGQSCKNAWNEARRQGRGDMEGTHAATAEASASPPLSLRWLQFTCGSGPCGGFADRLKGLMTSLLFALLSGRALSIDLKRPSPLQDALLPGVLPWLTAETVQETRAKPETLAPLDERAHRRGELQAAFALPARLLDLVDRSAVGGYPSLSRDVKSGPPLLRVRDNLNRWSELFDTYPDHSRRFGFDPASDLDVYFGCLYDFLFRPSRQMANMVNGHLRTMRKTTWQRAFPWTNTQHERTDARTKEPQRQTNRSNDKPDTAVALASAAARVAAAFSPPSSVCAGSVSPVGVSSSPLLSVQLRFGASTATSFKDSESFLRADAIPTVLTHLQEIAIKWAQRWNRTHNKQDAKPHASPPPSLCLPPFVLVASDSPAVFPLASSYFLSPPFSLVSLPGGIVHVDRFHVSSVEDRAAAREGQLRAIAEHYLIGEATTVLVSPTGFGATAVWRTAFREGLHKRDGQDTEADADADAASGPSAGLPLSSPLVRSEYRWAYRVSRDGRTLQPFSHVRGSDGRPQKDPSHTHTETPHDTDTHKRKAKPQRAKHEPGGTRPPTAAHCTPPDAAMDTCSFLSDAPAA